jgi:metallophosphoesterase (TIGR03767 family)
LGLAAAAAALFAAPALGAPHTTLERTIFDREEGQPLSADFNLLEYGPGEDYVVIGADERFRPPRQGSILNFLQLSDFQMVDEESPGRVEFFDTTQRIPGAQPFSAAYRPQESLTTQITEAMVRQARNTTSPVTGERLDLSILTGDNADSQQYNETRWFIDILDGTVGSPAKIDPDSGVEAAIDGCDTGGLPYEDNESPYDGVRGGGKLGYYEPDSSAPDEDGDGYSPRPHENFEETGKPVTVRDFPGLFEAAQDPFEAVGLGMPWYTAFGNHDALVQGNSPHAYAGPVGDSTEPDNDEAVNESFDAIVRGCLKPTQSGGATVTEFLADPLAELAGSAPIVVPPDERRCHLSKDRPTVPPPLTEFCNRGWIAEHGVTRGTPVGHGFANRPGTAINNHDGYYAFSPRPGLRFIVLDTVTDECGTEFCSEGSVDNDQFVWLDGEISAAAARGEYVLVFAHHSLETTNMPTTDLTEAPLHYGDEQSPPGGETLEQLFCRHQPNVLAHVNGHEHANEVEQRSCPVDPEDQEPPQPASFWEVTTAAHIDWPQQSRMIELVENEDHTISLVLTILDHDGPPNPGNSRSQEGGTGAAGEAVLRLASIGREIAYNDYQHSRGARGDREDRNVIIKTTKPWTFGSD